MACPNFKDFEGVAQWCPLVLPGRGNKTYVLLNYRIVSVWEKETFLYTFRFFWLVCCCFSYSVTQSYPTLCNPTDWRKPGCSSLSPRICSNSWPLSQWSHPAISSSVVPFSSCRQSFPSSGALPMSLLFKLGGQIIGVSSSTSVLTMNIQDNYSQDWLVWFPCCPRDSQESSPAPQFESINSLVLSLLMVQMSHPYLTTEKIIIWLYRPLLAKWCLSFLIHHLSLS